ncbi:hypothetical protein [Pleomorphomonas sp. JP5]|uniref:hypothetical protein n=1 Tax=Pleomorphomonas sp. JP5 TaxID=2942998 RepID=UPI002043F00F|nr:hypothetical protein [Pleomorphomonas sp. JP5]MCM5557244.1 hypothetical protein [Pleomorphomonas sp. JP5]
MKAPLPLRDTRRAFIQKSPLLIAKGCERTFAPIELCPIRVNASRSVSFTSRYRRHVSPPDWYDFLAKTLRNRQFIRRSPPPACKAKLTGRFSGVICQQRPTTSDQIRISVVSFVF